MKFKSKTGHGGILPQGISPRVVLRQARYNTVMFTILAIETSTELASVALLQGPHAIVRESAGVQNHSQTVLPMVQELLAEAGIALQQCEALAFGAGPGSFTGVRTACGIAQGLAFAAELPVIPVITLQAMAQACHVLHGASDVAVVLDARMEEVYWAQYRFDGEWHTVVEPTLSPPSGVKPLGRVVVCGNGLSAYPAAFEDALFADRIVPIQGPHGLYVAQLARPALAMGRTVTARSAQPFYLRNKIALTTAERQAKITA